MSKGVVSYLPILRVRRALVFDLGALLIRMFSAQVVLGIVSMLTLCGWSFLLAGSVSSVVAISAFLISPQVSRQADRLGQSKVVPAASALALVGLAIMLATLGLEGPFWLCYPAAVLMGFCPNAPSMARARWTYLIETDKLGHNAPDLKAVYAYEGVLDDASFMLGPSIAIALASMVFPVAGMLFGGILLLLGSILLLLPRSTEPKPGWTCADETQQAKNESTTAQRSMFVTSGFVRALFSVILILGFFYSTHDTVIIAIGEQFSCPEVISIILVLASLVSMLAGLIYGSLKIKASLPTQLAVLCAAYGLAYGMMFFVANIPQLMAVCIASAMFYGPTIIAVNTLCERGVPNSRLTESLTWVNSGYTCGSAVAPITSGIAVDVWGGFACLKLCGIVALCVLVVGLLVQPIVRKHMR